MSEQQKRTTLKLVANNRKATPKLKIKEKLLVIYNPVVFKDTGMVQGTYRSPDTGKVQPYVIACLTNYDPANNIGHDKKGTRFKFIFDRKANQDQFDKDVSFSVKIEHEYTIPEIVNGPWCGTGDHMIKVKGKGRWTLVWDQAAGDLSIYAMTVASFTQRLEDLDLPEPMVTQQCDPNRAKHIQLKDMMVRVTA